jgi:long-subunit acyl-CoA synthetase (AMP-forming)
MGKVKPFLSRVEMKARREATRLAGLSFTSGSTGAPKAVRVTQGRIARSPDRPAVSAFRPPT